MLHACTGAVMSYQLNQLQKCQTISGLYWQRTSVKGVTQLETGAIAQVELAAFCFESVS